MRIRQPKGKRKTTCSKCKKQILGKYSYCKDCRNAYMRENRKKYIHSNEQQLKIKARHVSAIAAARGKIVKLGCYICGVYTVEAHHNDYSKPLQIIWLCRSCHLSAHLNEPIGSIVKYAKPAPIVPTKGRKTTCSKCDKPKEEKRKDQRYCNSCHAANMRASREKKKAATTII